MITNFGSLFAGHVDLEKQGQLLVLHVATAPALLQTGSYRLRQFQGIIQLPACQKSGVRGYGGAVELRAEPIVELKPDGGANASPIGSVQRDCGIQYQTHG